MPTPERFRAQSRSILDLRRHSLPTVPAFGYYNYGQANSALPEHSHPGAIEVCYMVRGQQAYAVSGKTYLVRSNDLFITFPQERHSTGGTPEEKGILYWFIMLDPALTGGTLAGLSPKESATLWRAMKRLPTRHFAGTGAVKLLLDAILAEGHLPRSPLRKITLSNRFVALLLAILEAGRAQNAADQPGRFDAVFEHINHHLDDPAALDLASLAAVAELSLSHFKARFKQATGFPPAEYVLRARVEEARRRLTTSSASITEIAFALGFSSSQHFAAAFRRIFGRTPRQARGESLKQTEFT